MTSAQVAARLQRIGGQWDPHSKTWLFPPEKAPQLAALLLKAGMKLERGPDAA